VLIILHYLPYFVRQMARTVLLIGTNVDPVLTLKTEIIFKK
jgi:hypothetical protein